MRAAPRTAVWCGRLLLCAALLFGVVTMHTFGHPASGHGGHATLTATAAHDRGQATGPAAHDQDTAVAPHHRTTVAAAPDRGTPTAAHERPVTRSAAHRAEGDGGAMDPGSVCRAVLTAGAAVLLTLLTAAALLHVLSGLAALLGGRPAPGPWPISPPPRQKLLARLSVLRV